MSGLEGGRVRQYLSFSLDGETFAIEIPKVREVLEYTRITRVPKMPEFMRGVINLRGTVVPIADMRLKFGMAPKEPDLHTSIVVMEIELDGETMVMGALVDSVREVLELDEDQVEPPPKMGTVIGSEFIKGMGKHNDEFLIILDMDRIFAEGEMEFVAEVSSENRGDAT